MPEIVEYQKNVRNFASAKIEPYRARKSRGINGGAARPAE